MKETKRKGFNFYRSYYDVFNELPEKDKLAFIKALLNKQFLDEEPEKLTGMVKFAWISQYNSIDQQVKGYKSKSKDPMQGGRQGGCVRGEITPTLQEKEKEKEKEKEQYVRVFNFSSFLIDYGFNKELVKDWMLVRKTKKATNTETAYNAFIKEIEKKDCDINEILSIIIQNDWKGFKWAWMDNKKQDKEPTALELLKSDTALKFKNLEKNGML